MKRIILKPREERRILLGHPWVYDNEIARVLAGPGPEAKSAILEPGELADLESSDKKYLGRAFVNPNSKITARIYSRSKEGADKGFFKRRIREAILRRIAPGNGMPTGQTGYDLRKESARLVFSEADFLPGLIIDRFVGWPLDVLESAVSERPISFEAASAALQTAERRIFPDGPRTAGAGVALGSPSSWLSAQFLSRGMDERREMILDALEEVLAAPLLPGQVPLGAPAGIVEKSGAKARELEGLPPREGLVRGSFPPAGIVIFEHALPFAVHLEEGQKTGHFLDQRDNRRLAAAYLSNYLRAGSGATDNPAPNGRACEVLDACSYTGGFAIHAALAGASSVVCVDTSAPALETLKKNSALNGVGAAIKAVEADVFEYLRAAERRKECFDLIILDPPAFAKTRASLNGAIRGYKEINLRAISLLKKGGMLITCSCSQAMSETRFKKMLAEAAADAERRLIQLDFRYQASDHPVLMGFDESFYLKCGFYRALG